MSQYCVRGNVEKRLYPGPLNSHYPLVQWSTVMLMLVLILQCYLNLQGRIIDFTNAFAQADISSGGPVFLKFLGISIVM